MQTTIKQLTWAELENWRREGKDFQLVDVREPAEHEAFNIGGELIPLSNILKQTGRLQAQKPIVVYCKRGIRSQIAIQRWMNRLRDADFYNLQGGIWHLWQGE